MSGVRLNDGPGIKIFILVGWGRSFFVCCLAQRDSTIGFLLLQHSSGVVRHPRDLQVSVATRSVESSSLFHHSIYLWIICFPWWSIDELENLHADRTTVCLEPWQKPRARLGSRKTGLSPPPRYFNYWPFQDGASVVVPVTCSCCRYLYFSSAIMLMTYFSKF